LETKNIPNDLNLKKEQRVSFGLVALAFASLPFGILLPEVFAGSAAAVSAVIVLNRDLYALFVRRRGILFATACIPLHLFYYLYSGVSYCWVWLDFQRRRIATVQFIPTSNPIQSGAVGGAEKNS
jgi:hypothetical protein